MTELLQDLRNLVAIYGKNAIAVIGPERRVVGGFDTTGDSNEQRREQARVIAEDHNRRAKDYKPLVEKRYRDRYTVRLATAEIARLEAGAEEPAQGEEVA
jgi:hypothetical protein